MADETREAVAEEPREHADRLAGVAEELKECHETFRSSTDQGFKAITFLAAVNAALISVALEQQKALALAASALLPIAGWVIAAHVGRQFGAAVSRGAVLEFQMRGQPIGFFWMHLRSGLPPYAVELARGLDVNPHAADNEAAPVLRPAVVRFIPYIVVVELATVPLSVVLLGWSWA